METHVTQFQPLAEPLEAQPEWRALDRHAAKLRDAHLRELFAGDANRAERLGLALPGLYADFSRQRMAPETVELFARLFAARGLEAARDAMFTGAPINTTENRAVLHVALRAGDDARIEVDGRDVMEDVRAERARVRDFCERLRSGELRGATGERLNALVNIGIGGSDLGPCMASAALAPYTSDALDVRYVSNLDASHLLDALHGLDPARTLFVVASKTFTTLETLTNARTARDWLVSALGEQAVARHFVALSTNAEAVAEFGISTDRTFGFWDWVGGRYSLWSAIGLPLAADVGPDRFDELLAGARAMDAHFSSAPPAANLPLMMAAAALWNTHFLGARSLAVVPYDQRLARLPAYLQQLEMESNGKRVTHAGEALAVPSCPVLWGEPGTNGQHAFFQLLHQGTEVVPVDFIACANAHHEAHEHQRLLLANCLAQAEALARGQTEAEAHEAGADARLAPHQVFPGNRPSTTLLLEALTPFALGQLLAAYEHKVFAVATVLGINAFDQYGVELGKRVARRIAASDTGAGTDPATARLAARIARFQEGASSA